MSRSCWCCLCVSVPCGHMCRSIAKPSLPFLPLPCTHFKQAGLKRVFFSFSDSSFPFPCNYHNCSLFTHLLSHPWPRVPMAFPLLLHGGWRRRVCPTLLPNLPSHSTGMGAQALSHCASTGMWPETTELETGERSMRGVKNNNTKNQTGFLQPSGHILAFLCNSEDQGP